MFKIWLYLIVLINAVILARGGSKGIKRKNIIDFLGKPLLAWTLEQCINAKSISNVWVSSDDDEILHIAKKYGANPIKRPIEISDDEATSESGWLHAIEYLEHIGINTDIILAPQVTSPLRESKDIDLAVEKFKTEKLDSLFSASVAEDLFFWEENDDGTMESVNYDYNDRKRRQDLQKQIIENGSFYLFKVASFRKGGNRFSGKTGYYEMEFWKMFEIDTFDDVRMCSALMNEFMVHGGDGSD